MAKPKSKVRRSPIGFNVIFDRLGNLSKDATKTVNPLKPNLASADYIIHHVNPGFDAVPDAKDYTFGDAERWVNVRTWWLLDICLTYPETALGASPDDKVYYNFTIMPANSVLLHDMQQITNRILRDLYERLGEGKGEVYYSRILPDDVNAYIQSGHIQKMEWTDNDRYNDWIVEYSGDSLT